MDELDDLEMLPTGEHLIAEISEHSQILRNYYESADPEASRELLYLLVLKFVTNEQIKETLYEVMQLPSTLP